MSAGTTVNVVLLVGVLLVGFRNIRDAWRWMGERDGR